MNTLIKKILRTGIIDNNSEQEVDESRRIFLTNLISLMMCITATIYIFIFYIFNSTILSILTIPVAFIFSICIYLNHLHYYILSRITLILIACIATLIDGFYLGFEIGIHTLFFALVFLPFFIFENKKTITIMLLVTIFFFLLLVLSYNINNIKPTLKIESILGKTFFIIGNLTVFSFMIFNYYFYNSSMIIFYDNKLKRSEDIKNIIENKNRELEIANKKLKESRAIQENLAYKAALGTLIMGIHHEIRNPMNMVKIGCQSMKMKIKDQDYIMNTCDDLIEVVDKLDEITTSMLDYGKESAPDNKKKLNVNNVIKSFVKLSNTYIDREKIIIDLKLGDIPEITANHNQLYQIIMNLVINASEAMLLEKDHKIEISTYKTMFTPLNKSNKDEKTDGIAIKIVDTGSGIPEEKLKHILDPFYTTKQNNTGLGLSIVFNIILSYNGNIEIKSNPGEGTEVIIYLPEETKSTDPQIKINNILIV